MRTPRSRMARGAAAALTAAVAVLLVPGAAHADHPAELSERELTEVLGKQAAPIDGDLFRVAVRGPDLVTHGPDTKLEDAPVARGAGFSAGDPERSPVCGGQYQQHILYGRLAADPNNYAASAEPIRAAVRRMNAVLNADSLDSGGPTADYRVRCEGSGEISVGSFTATATSFSSIVNAAKSAGYDDADVDYTIFFDGGSACGIGSYYDDDRLAEGNYNNRGGSYAVSYGGCWYGTAPMHENGHNQGAVQYDAPYSTGSGAHCWDERDVMCYSPDGGDTHQQGTINRCTDRTYFDCGFDTYFDSSPEGGEWLATHWNLGSPLNRFIAFGAGSGANTPPGASFSFTCELLRCEFQDTSIDSDGTIAARAWSFGGGAGSAAARPSHEFSAPGTHAVTLTVTDDDGASDSVTRTVAVESSAEPPDPGPANPGDPDGSAPGPASRLRNRRGVAAVAGRAGSWDRYLIKVPRKRRVLKVKLSGPGCDARPCATDLDLFVRRGRAPKLARFHCAPRLVGSDEVCKIRRPRKGRWHIGVHVYEGSGDAGYRIKALHKRRRR